MIFSYDRRASQNILSQALQEAFFTALRSEQKTAYIARSSDLEIEKRLYQTFAVQSNSNDGMDLLTRFEIFIDGYVDNLETNIDEKRFSNIKNSLIETLENPYKNLSEMTATYNALAFDFSGDFFYYDKRIKALKKLSYQDFLTFSKNTLSKNNRRRLAVLFEGKIKNDFKYRNLKDLDLKEIGFYKTSKVN